MSGIQFLLNYARISEKESSPTLLIPFNSVRRELQLSTNVDKASGAVFRNCVSGRKLVSWFLSNFCNKREDAFSLAQAMLEQ